MLKKIAACLASVFAFYFVIAGEGTGGASSVVFTVIGPFDSIERCEAERAAVSRSGYTNYVSARCWSGT